MQEILKKMPNADTKILWPRCETKYCVYRM